HRYHLLVSYASPWASRDLIMRRCIGFYVIIAVSVVNALMVENGWTFEPDEGVVPDAVIDAVFLYEIYTIVEPEYSGRVTVPVLYVLKTDTIVNNESAEIMRMFNSAFHGLGGSDYDFAPEE